MFIDKEKIEELFKEGKLRTQEDMQDFLKEASKTLIETLAECEMAEDLGYKKHEQKKGGRDNHRNGYSRKKVKSSSGEIELKLPRDRQGKFEPSIVEKHQRDITGIEAKVLSMYAKGMSTRDINGHLKDIYGIEYSAQAISNMTEAVSEKAREWQNRPLEEFYPIVYIDALVIKMRLDRYVRNVAVYAIIGINIHGYKECLGLYFGLNESASEWLEVMNELRNRGINDVLIFCVDNLQGISKSISAAFPEAKIQKCIVHQVRNSLKNVNWRMRKTVAADLRTIYISSSEEEAQEALSLFEKKWDGKYPYISKSWRKHWDELSAFYPYPPEVRRLIYTTNPIESFNRRLRKVIKTKGAFPSEDSALKLLYLVVEELSLKWCKKKIDNWGMVLSQFSILFEDRMEKYL